MGPSCCGWLCGGACGGFAWFGLPRWIGGFCACATLAHGKANAKTQQPSPTRIRETIEGRRKRHCKASRRDSFSSHLSFSKSRALRMNEVATGAPKSVPFQVDDAHTPNSLLHSGRPPACGRGSSGSNRFHFSKRDRIGVSRVHCRDDRPSALGAMPSRCGLLHRGKHR